MIKIKFLKEEIDDFFDKKIPNKAVKDILLTTKKATITVDSRVLKKLQGDIWELRILSNRIHYRLLAFWDKRDKETTYIVVSNGFIKKTAKTPLSEIKKAENIRKQYFATN